MSNRKVIVCTGLPGSGKSTWAKEWVAKNPTNRVRINKDDLRAMLHGGKYSKGNERQVVCIEQDILLDSLERGKSVVIDNTHLATNKDGLNKHFERIKTLVGHNQTGVDVELKEFNVSPEECIKRDLQRPNSVGQNVIWRMYWDHVAEIQPSPVIDIDKQNAIMVDVDGTLAQMEGRGPFDWPKVKSDSVRQHIKWLVQNYYEQGCKIIILTGRDGCCLDLTTEWLTENSIPFDSVFIRPEGDRRKDFVVKREIYENNIAPYYNIKLVVDDRPQVIREWRRLGLPVINVNPSDRDF